MCGIAGVYLRDPELRVDLDAMLDTLLDCIEHRGGDATGYLALNAEGVAEWHRAACDVPEFVKYRRPVPKGTRTILAHTRWATQGLPAFIENNHPIRRGPFYVIHNGHVSNDRELFKLAKREPFGQVDSEAIPARLASLGGLDRANVVMKEIEGAAAIAAVDERNPDQLLLSKGHSSPLYVLVTNKVVLWGSTELTVKKAYESHIGRIPKKRKIESLAAGQTIFFFGSKQVRSGFKPYTPKRTGYVYSTSPAWQETMEPAGSTHSDVPVTRHLPTIGGWPKWDGLGKPKVSEETEEVEKWDEKEYWDCELCSAKVHWTEATEEKDSDGHWWTLCATCHDDLRDEFVSEDVADVNAEVLKDLDR